MTAMQLALERVWDHQATPSRRIYTDSQTALKAIERPRRQSGQSITKDLLDCIDEILDKHGYLQIDMVDTKTLGDAG
jgi:ribonuclease HI